MELGDPKSCTPRVWTRVVNKPGSDSAATNGPPVRSRSLLSLGASEARLEPVRLGDLTAVAFTGLGVRERVQNLGRGCRDLRLTMVYVMGCTQMMYRGIQRVTGDGHRMYFAS